MIYPSSLRKLIDSFKDLPGIGEKTAERLAFSMISFNKDKLTSFANNISDVANLITKCKVCSNICESDICFICDDSSRQGDVIFVVENAKDVISFEKIGVYHGTYHVLQGLISPLEGVLPEDINLESLIKRINENDVKEIILALKPSVEGETTSQYIRKRLENTGVKVSKIASGIPLGAEIDYIDPMTLEMALEERKYLS